MEDEINENEFEELTTLNPLILKVNTQPEPKLSTSTSYDFMIKQNPLMVDKGSPIKMSEHKMELKKLFEALYEAKNYKRDDLQLELENSGYL